MNPQPKTGPVNEQPLPAPKFTPLVVRLDAGQTIEALEEKLVREWPQDAGHGVVCVDAKDRPQLFALPHGGKLEHVIFLTPWGKMRTYKIMARKAVTAATDKTPACPGHDYVLLDSTELEFPRREDGKDRRDN